MTPALFHDYNDPLVEILDVEGRGSEIPDFGSGKHDINTSVERNSAVCRCSFSNSYSFHICSVSFLLIAERAIIS